MGASGQDRERFQATARQEWREWLSANHAAARGVWLVSSKKATGKPRLSYDEAVEEALCFGWIDSRPNRLDADRSMLLFTPRQAGSPWSRLNKTRVARLLDEGRMAPAGLAAIEMARRDGSWTAYDSIENLEVPADLEAALEGNVEARTHFAAVSASTKKQLLWWVASPKQAATRARRIERLVSAAAVNQNPLAAPKAKPG